MRILDSIYKEHIYYKRAGVILSEVTPNNPLEQDLFDPIKNRRERTTLMKAVDYINQKFGTKTIMLATEGDHKQPWSVKCEHRTPNYLTDINELLNVKI